MSGVVFITGAGSGIGRSCAEVLRARGLTVIAGVRDGAERDVVSGRGDEVESTVVFDVRDDAAVENAAQTVLEALGSRRLVGIVNSAGIVVAGPLELMPDDDLRRQFDVNVFGLMSVTRAFLPRLREDRGRVVNMGSVGGRLSVPFTGAYSGSKFAVRALSDALRFELADSGVHVALIEPGAIATEIWETSLDAGLQLADSLGGRLRELYGARVDRIEVLTRKTQERAIPPERVGQAVAHALLAKRPRADYLVGLDAIGQSMLSRLPARIRDGVFRRIMG